MPPSESTPKYVTHTPELIAGFFGDYRFLSNFHPAKVVLSGQAYPSVENAYQAAKMPVKERQAFITCSAAEAKRLGRQAVLPANWDTDKFPIMPLRVEERDFINQGPLQTEEDKARVVFLTNYCATYGNVSAEDGERAFQEFRAKQAYSRAVSKNPELRMQQSELFRKGTQMPLSAHVFVLAIQFAIFAYLRLTADF
jgi:hypothetical protein